MSNPARDFEAFTCSSFTLLVKALLFGELQTLPSSGEMCSPVAPLTLLSEEPSPVSDAHQSGLGSAAAVGGLGVSVGVSIQLLCN